MGLTCKMKIRNLSSLAVMVRVVAMVKIFEFFTVWKFHCSQMVTAFEFFTVYTKLSEMALLPTLYKL